MIATILTSLVPPFLHQLSYNFPFYPPYYFNGYFHFSNSTLYQQHSFIVQYPYTTPPTFPFFAPQHSAETRRSISQELNPDDSMCRNLFSYYDSPGNPFITPSGNLTTFHSSSTGGTQAHHFYVFTYHLHLDFLSVETFGALQSKFKDPTAFIVNFRERLRLFKYPDVVLFLLFPTYLKRIVWNWYASFPKGLIFDFSVLSQKFLAHFEIIKKFEVTCDSILSIKQVF
jgi:hypothetical protein